MAASGRGPAVVFIPGFMQRGDAWAPVAKLVGERYPSACLDLHSSRLDELAAEITAAAPAAAALVGYSMGGRLALRVALESSSPGRRALILVGAGAGIEDEAERAARRERDEELAAWIERQPIEAVVERWERQPVFADQPPALVEAQRAGRLSHDPRALAATLRSVGQGTMAAVWDQLAGLELPTLAIAGARDAPYVAAAQRIAELAPLGHAAVVPDAGHAPQLERPDAVARLAEDFLDEHLG